MAVAKTDKIKDKKKTYERWFEQIVTISLFTPHHEDNPIDPSCRWGQPCILWGGSGIGKSARIRQISKKVNLGCRVLMPAQRMPEDFAGVLAPNPKDPSGISIECLLPAVRHLVSVGSGVLFIDEAGNAPPAVQGAMLGMLLDRVVGDTPLPPKVRILLAANPPEIAAGGFNFDPPTANRMSHFDIGPPSFDEWAKYYSNRYNLSTATVDYESIVAREWASTAPRIQGMLMGFLHKNQSAKDAQPPAGDPASSRAWPSSRTWEMAANAMMTRKILGFDEELDDIMVGGFVGEGPANEFAAWRRDADLPAPEDVLDGKWKHNPRRLDISYAVMSTVIPYLSMLPRGEKQSSEAAKAWKLMDRMIDASASDLVVDPVKNIVNSLQLGLTGTFTSPEIQAEAKVVLKKLSMNGHGELISG